MTAYIETQNKQHRDNEENAKLDFIKNKLTLILGVSAFVSDFLVQCNMDWFVTYTDFGGGELRDGSPNNVFAASGGNKHRFSDKGMSMLLILRLMAFWLC